MKNLLVVPGILLVLSLTACSATEPTSNAADVKYGSHFQTLAIGNSNVIFLNAHDSLHTIYGQTSRDRYYKVAVKNIAYAKQVYIHHSLTNAIGLICR